MIKGIFKVIEIVYGIFRIGIYSCIFVSFKVYYFFILRVVFSFNVKG